MGQELHKQRAAKLENLMAALSRATDHDQRFVLLEGRGDR